MGVRWRTHWVEHLQAFVCVDVHTHTHSTTNQQQTNNQQTNHHQPSRPADQQTNNNHNPIWRGSASTVEEPPPHSGELHHALSPVGGPTHIPAVPPYVVRTPHLHGAPTSGEHFQLNSDTDASDETNLEEYFYTKKKVRNNGKHGKKKYENMNAGSPLKLAIPTPPCPPRPKH